MNKIFSVLLILSMSLNGFAAPEVAPLSSLPKPTGKGQCSFEPELSNDDKALLESASNAINTLRQNSKCSAMASQFDAFQEALKAYNQQTGADRVPGYDGNLNVTCANYESIYDSNFQFFTDNWDDPGTGLSTDDLYFNCRNKTDRDEAVECGALITGRSKNYKKAQCDAQKDAISAQAMGQLLNHSYTTGLEAIQAILNNNECIDSSGEQKLSFIQSAVGLASRAASMSLLGSGAGLLVGAASQVVGSAIKNFFTNSARNRDHMAILDNRENFTRVACLYEQVEAKALRCDRISASRNLDALVNTQNKMEAACEDPNLVMEANAGVQGIESLMAALKAEVKPEATAKTLEQPEFDVLIEQLNAKLPGTETTVMGSALEASRDIASDMAKSLENDDAIKSYLAAKNEGKTDYTGAELRSAKAEIEQNKKLADNVINVLETIKTADGKGTSMDASDLLKVQEAMKSFDGGPLSFTGTYNQLMIMRATKDDDLSKQIKSYNSRLEDVQLLAQHKVITSNQANMSSGKFDDGGRFVESKAAIRPHLEKIMQRELTALSYRAYALKDILPGKPSSALKDNLRTQEEGVIYPLLRACSQLRSVNTEAAKKGLMNVSSGQEPAVCRAFNCDGGAQTFEDYVASHKLPAIDPKQCDTVCMAQYDRFICQQRNTLNSSRNKIKKEFLENGTICGKSMAQAFGDVKKKDVIPLPSFGLFKKD